MCQCQQGDSTQTRVWEEGGEEGGGKGAGGGGGGGGGGGRGTLPHIHSQLAGNCSWLVMPSLTNTHGNYVDTKLDPGLLLDSEASATTVWTFLF